MAISIPRSLVEYVLLGPTGDRRQLQDSPILGDVWIAFAKDPQEPQELLITPHKTQTAGSVAIRLDELLHQDRGLQKKHRAEEGLRPVRKQPAHIAYLQGIIAARLYFDELLRIVVPMTQWWGSRQNQKDMRVYLDEQNAARTLDVALTVLQIMAAHWSAPTKNPKVDVLLSALRVRRLWCTPPRSPMS